MRRKGFFVQSTIAKRISKKMFSIYICIYISLLFLLILILLPALYRTALNKSTENLSVISDEYRMLQDSMKESINNFYLSSDLETTLENYSVYQDPAGKSLVNLALSKIASCNSDLLAISLEDSDGNFFTSQAHSYVDRQKLLHSYPKYTELLKYKYSSYFSPMIADQFHTEYINYSCFAYSQNIRIGLRNYVATVFYNSNTIMRHCIELSDADFSYFTIFDRYGDTLFSSRRNISYITADSKFNAPQSSSGYYHVQGGMIFYKINPSTNCAIVAYAPYKRLFENTLYIIGTITILYLISPILYGFFLAPVTQKQLSPLKKLSETMSSYSVGDEIQADIHTNDEIEIVSDSFNQMIIEINRQIKEIKEKEHENSVINYKLLATQIDPHFIYNTMHIINIMARDGKTDAVVEINSALIKILRERLNSKLNIFDTIRNEIDTLMQYCLITNYRYRNHITIRFDVDDAIQEQKIPKNILQPLVENAFFHGFPAGLEIPDGNVEVLIYSINADIIIEVNDNGRGMPQERIREILDSSYTIYNDNKPHIGIDNIRQRLEYLYNGKYDLDIQSTPGQGTTISITIPKI